MTEYNVFKEEGQGWQELGTAEANTPEGAIKKRLKDELTAAASNGQEGQPSVRYAACPVSSWTTASPEAQVETQVRIKINSDRVIQPRKTREQQPV